MADGYKLDPPLMIYMLRRDKFAKEIELAQMKRRDIRVATQILTGHATLNYYLSKLNRTTTLMDFAQLYLGPGGLDARAWVG